MKFVSSARVGIVVPVHNRLSHTQQLLAELRSSDHDEAMIVVVDDGSTDGTSEYLQERDPDVLVLHGGGDLWWSGSANLGCRFAIDRGAEVLVLLNNDDVRVSENCIDELVRCVDSSGGCASAVALTGTSDRILQAGGLTRWPFRGIELRESGRPFRREDRVVECDWLPGMTLAFSAELFEELGGFDAEAFPQYCGDADFTLRARRHGRRCLVSYNCFVSNDEKTSGMHFYSRVSPVAFVSGLFSLRSSYRVDVVLRFALRHCPKHLIPAYLAQFYLRYAYATLKTWLPARLRLALTR